MKNLKEELSDLRRKSLAMLGSSEVSDLEVVEWLNVFSKRGQLLLHSSNPIQGGEADIRREYNRFGTGVSGQRVVEWAHLHKITLNHNEHWWFIRERQSEYSQGKAAESDLLVNPPLTGHLAGIPNSHGIPRITNGIDLWMERLDGTTFLGHRDALVWDRRAKDDVERFDLNGNLIEKVKPSKPSPTFFSHHLALATKILSDNSILSFAGKFSEKTGKGYDLTNPTPETLAPLVKEWMDKVVEESL